MFKIHNLLGLILTALLVTGLPVQSVADEPVADPQDLPPLELSTPAKHSGQVSFGFGTHGAFSQMSGIYSLSPRLYARYGLGVSQGFGRSDLFASSLTRNHGLEATQYFFSLSTPALLRFGDGIGVGAEVYISNGPLYQGSWFTPGSSRYGLGFYDAETSAFMSPWHRRAWNRDPALEGKSWYIQVDVQQTTDQGTHGARLTVGK